MSDDNTKTTDVHEIQSNTCNYKGEASNISEIQNRSYTERNRSVNKREQKNRLI